LGISQNQIPSILGSYYGLGFFILTPPKEVNL
jgi:hypothetical protein